MNRIPRPSAGLALLIVLVWTGSASAQDLPDPSQLWALVVGISGYTNAEPLRYAASDALSIAEFLKSPRGGSFREDRVIILTEDRASRFGIFAEIEQLQDKVQPGDMVVIFLAGHGFVNQRGIGYFIPSDGDLRMPAPTSIPFTALKELIELGLSQVQFRVLMTDLCHSGRIGPEKSELAQKIQNLINENLLQLDGGSGSFLNLLASRPTEASWEMDDLGGGVFSHVLLEALNGAGDGPEKAQITADEVVSYVLEGVPRYTSNQQHPMSNREFDPERPLSYPGLPGPQPAVDLTAPVTLLVPSLCPYSRVEWLDPITGATTVQQIQNSPARMELGPLVPGQYEFRFLGDGGKSVVIQREVSQSGTVIDLGDPQANLRFPETWNRFASLGLSLPPTFAWLAQSPVALPSRTASISVRLPPQTRLLLDDRFLAEGGDGGYIQLTGLTPGVHRIYLELPADREYRYRLHLREGLQELDWRTGQMRPLAELPQLPGLRSIPDDIPQPIHALLLAFRESLWQGNLIGTDGDSAVEILSQLESGGLPESDAESLRRSLTVTMGDRAQRIVLRYLEGGDIHWIPEVFEEGAALIGQVRAELKPNPVLESQEHFFRGRALLERGNFELAANELRRSIELDPEASHSHNALGLALWRQQRLGEAVEPLRRALELSPDWNYPRITLALIRLELREYAEAERLFREAMVVEPDDSTASHGLGQLLALAGNWEEAEALFRQAIEFSPGNAYACHSLARLFMEQYRFEEAESLLRLALRLVPEEREFRLALADLLRRMGRLREADQAFGQLLDASPDDAFVLLAWAEYLGQSGRFDQAVPVLGQALQRAGRQANPLVRAGLFWRDHDRGKAYDYFRRAAEIDPANPFAHYNLAVLQVEDGRLDDAVREIERSIKGDSRYVPPRLLLTRVLSARGDYPKAWATVQEARELVFEAEQRHSVEELSDQIQSSLVSSRTGEIRRQIDRNRISAAWKALGSALREFPGSRELRNLALEFLAGPGKGVDVTDLPSGPLKEAVNSPFWIGLRDSEALWQEGKPALAISSALASLEQLQPQDPVLLTSFNLGNPDFSVHSLVSRWVERAVSASDYAQARALFERALEQRIFSAVPGLSPLTIDSLMVPDAEETPQVFSDFEVARHPDPEAHRLLALIRAGSGADLSEISGALAAVEAGGPVLSLRTSIARVLLDQGRGPEARDFLESGIAGAPDVAAEDPQGDLREAALLYAEIAVSEGDPLSALRILESAQRAVPEDRELSRKIEEIRRAPR